MKLALSPAISRFRLQFRRFVFRHWCGGAKPIIQMDIDQDSKTLTFKVGDLGTVVVTLAGLDGDEFCIREATLHCEGLALGRTLLASLTHAYFDLRPFAAQSFDNWNLLVAGHRPWVGVCDFGVLYGLTRTGGMTLFEDVDDAFFRALSGLRDYPRGSFTSDEREGDDAA